MRPLERYDGMTVLVVDDEEFVLATMSSVLEDLGFVVIAADSAETAYAQVLEARRIDLVVSDVMMPGESGPALARRLRSTYPDLPIIFVTGYASQCELQKELVLPKPFTLQAFERFVAQGLNRSV
jgi:two-component system cell cycle sensor histidine kinase/response regulator CckA